MSQNYSENLFSYGTLRTESVQRETFGRLLEGTEEKLIGYKLSMIEITDPDVLKTSGERFHPIIEYTGDRSDLVEGTVFKISEQELAQADSYEVDDYQRVLADCETGLKAWVYVASNEK